MPPADAVSAAQVASLPDQVRDLYENHHAWLYGWLRGRLGDMHHAADLAHDTYVRVLTSGRSPSQSEARPHLMQIAKGLVIDRYRRQQIEQAYLEQLALLPEAVAPSAEERAIVLETLTRIDFMLSSLPVKVRDTFMLSQFDGLKYSEIAALQGISVATVRKYMLKAMESSLEALGVPGCSR